MSAFFGSIFILLLFVLCVMEWINFRRAERAFGKGDILPYPRKRLSRRIRIAALLGTAIALAAFVPSINPWINLYVLIFVAILIIIAIICLINELGESSKAAANYAIELSRLSRASVEELIRNAETERAKEDSTEQEDSSAAKL